MKIPDWVKEAAASKEEQLDQLFDLLEEAGGIEEAVSLFKTASSDDYFATQSVSKCSNKECGISLRINKFASSVKCPSCLCKVAADAPEAASAVSPNIPVDKDLENEMVFDDEEEGSEETKDSARDKRIKQMLAVFLGSMLGLSGSHMLGAGLAVEDFNQAVENQLEMLEGQRAQDLKKRWADLKTKVKTPEKKEEWRPGDKPKNKEDALKRYKMYLRHRLGTGGGGLKGVIPAGHPLEQDPERWISQLTVADVPADKK